MRDEIHISANQSRLTLSSRLHQAAHQETEMKLKTISRVEKDFTQEVNTDKVKVFRNYDPALHPFERAREVIPFGSTTVCTSSS